MADGDHDREALERSLMQSGLPANTAARMAREIIDSVPSEHDIWIGDGHSIEWTSLNGR